MKYEITKSDEWIRPVKVGYKMACCDCGLVHEIDFKIEDERVWFKVRRNNRSTAQVRRHKKPIIKNKSETCNHVIGATDESGNCLKCGNKVSVTIQNK